MRFLHYLRKAGTILLVIAAILMIPKITPLLWQGIIGEIWNAIRGLETLTQSFVEYIESVPKYITAIILIAGGSLHLFVYQIEENRSKVKKKAKAVKEIA